MTTELLSDVLGYRVTSFEYEQFTKQHGNNINFVTNANGIADEEDFINLDELTQCMKVWAAPKCSSLSIKYHTNKPKHTSPACVKVWINGKAFSAPTEPEAVDLACQWILENQ